MMDLAVSSSRGRLRLRDSASVCGVARIVTSNPGGHLAMMGTVSALKAGCGMIRDADGVSYVFTRADGDQAALRPGDRVEFAPVGPRFGRWRARNVMTIRSTSTTTTSKGATQ
jgi:hypothetical protein